MNKITAVIVEDQASSLENLLGKLERSCPHVKVIAQCRTGEEAVSSIHELEPQLVFLDVQLGTMTGFDVLERLQHVKFEVIFTTGYDKYAIQAIKKNALDYLLKPYNEKELIEAVKKAWQKIEPANNKGDDEDEIITLPMQNGLQLIKIKEIMYCEAFDNQTFVHLPKGKPLLISRTLKEITERLPAPKFFRIHRTFTINRNFIEFFSREDGGTVTMKKKEDDKSPKDKSLPVARNRKDEFLEWLD